MLDSLTLFDLIGRKLDHVDRRHQVLARNIANADTPGFIPQDVIEPDFRRLVAGRGVPAVDLVRTDPAHVAGAPLPLGARTEATPSELKPSGNAVSLDLEAGKLRSNSGAHKRATLLYGKYLGMLRTAVGDGR